MENKKNTLPKWLKWLAKDDDGELWAYEKKPYKISGRWYRQVNDEPIWLTIASSQYPSVTSEDEEPTLISDLYKEDENVNLQK